VFFFVEHPASVIMTMVTKKIICLTFDTWFAVLTVILFIIMQVE
jgi:hypothetical protein